MISQTVNKINPEDGDDGCPNQTTHFYEFKEYNLVVSLIDKLSWNSVDLRRRERAHQQFKYVCDTYQEQPHLFDPFLSLIYEKLIGVVKNAINPETKIEKNDQIELINEAFKYMHLLAKMRGYKHIVQYLPHETNDLEPIVRLLEQQDLKNVELWQTRYMLLIWLSIVCMIPFDLARFDDNTEQTAATTTTTNQEKIKERLLRVCVPYLSSGDACQDASAFLLGKFMSRQDVRDSTLPTFFQQLLDSIAESNSTGNWFRLLGSLKCISCIYKYGRREDLLKYTALTLRSLVKHNLLDNKLAVIRKFYIKVLQRVGTMFFKIKVAKWRYQRGSRVLMNLVNKPTGSVGDSVATTQGSSSKPLQNDEEADNEQIPEEIEEIIEQLMSGLRDKDTIVRWSSAKGIGRITNRLGLDPAEDVLSSLLDLFTYVEDDLAWHGGCLALAELARRGLLLPSQLANVVPIVLNALIFDKKLGNYSLGTNVRDSACYVCWAFARAFEPEVVAPYVSRIAAQLLVVSIFDREINCRRAASAAFQENVGRQGQFPHGIEIVTECDYHAVGQIQNCYLNLATFICSFEEYRQAMIDHLVEHKFNYWDTTVRELVAQCLFNLTSLCPDYMAFCVLPKLLKFAQSAIDLNTRHGALYSLGQLIHALCSLHTGPDSTANLVRLFPTETMQALKLVIDRIFDEKYFRGSGGEFIRPAVCFFIKKLAMSELIERLASNNDSDQLNGETFVRDCDAFIVQCIEYNKESVQAACVETIPFYCALKFKALKSKESTDEPSSKLVDSFIKNLAETTSSKEYIRSGYCLALGNLPFYVLANNDGFAKSVRALISSSTIHQQDSPSSTATASWVYARRDAIKALSALFKLLENDQTRSSLVTNPTSLILETFECYLNGLNDYTLDAKGDSGCHVREAALDAIDSLMDLCTNRFQLAEICSNTNLVRRLLAGVIQQAVERIDRTRAIAGRVFSRILFNPHLVVTESLTQLRGLFPKETCDTIDWNADHATLPVFVHLLRSVEFQDAVLVGFVYSIGSLTESLRKASTGSFLKELKAIEKENSNDLRSLMDKLLALCRANLKIDRLSSSLIRVVDLIVQDGLLKSFSDLPTTFLNVFLENVSTTKDIQRLTSYVDFFCDMLQFSEGESARVRVRSMQQLMIMLCHQYPRIRKATAQRLFEALINYPDIFDSDAENDECMTLLSETDWDQPVDKIREVRNRLCDLTKTPKPVLKKPAISTTTTTNQTTIKDQS